MSSLLLLSPASTLVLATCIIGALQLSSTGGIYRLHLCPPGSPELKHQREHWEQRQQKRRQQRSISKEKWVETLVVADSKMVEYHGQPQVESYVLTIMNMVRLLQFLQGWTE